MEKENLSAREKALVVAARREAEARKTGVTTAEPHPPFRAGQQRDAPERLKPSPAERLAQLMAEERAETERRKKKMRRYGLIISGTILGVFMLWLMRAFSRRR
ncbi:MAG TPA: hypothetical protein VK572_11795 [Burkholderiales bacterium]|nr:hypothetical protein [Burkholderiales bacterium]